MLCAHLMLVPPQVQSSSQQLLGNSLLGIFLSDPLASHHQGVGAGGARGAALPSPAPGTTEMWGAMRRQPLVLEAAREGLVAVTGLPAIALSPLSAAFLCLPAGTTVSSQAAGTAPFAHWGLLPSVAAAGLNLQQALGHLQSQEAGKKAGVETML